VEMPLDASKGSQRIIWGSGRSFPANRRTDQWVTSFADCALEPATTELPIYYFASPHVVAEAAPWSEQR
jgi:hypothetical protein